MPTPRPLRACKDCDRPTSRPDRRCPDCARAHNQARGTRHARGYGSAHERLREQWAPAVQAGTVDCHATTCVMPSRRIEPGTAWHLGHTEDRSSWTGPEHATCNTVDGGSRSHPVTGNTE